MLVDGSFEVPASYTAGGLRLELLGPRHNEADHVAWMSSIEHIRSTPGFDRDWPPPDGMTLAENLVDLVSHVDRSARRADFAYSVLDATTGDVVGCVYFKPTPSGEVQATSWVTAARAALDSLLTEIVALWLQRSWPFEVVHYRAADMPITICRNPAGPDPRAELSGLRRRAPSAPQHPRPVLSPTRRAGGPLLADR